jgi:hypothetical protein
MFAHPTHRTYLHIASKRHCAEGVSKYFYILHKIQVAAEACTLGMFVLVVTSIEQSCKFSRGDDARTYGSFPNNNKLVLKLTKKVLSIQNPSIGNKDTTREHVARVSH